MSDKFDVTPYLNYNESAINLDRLNLIELPIAILQYPDVKRIYCNDNKLTEIPYWIKAFQNLEYFECSNNLLTVLPDELYDLPNLIYLNCSQNKIYHSHENTTKLIIKLRKYIK